MNDKNKIMILCVHDKGKSKDRKFKVMSLVDLEDSRPFGWQIYFGPAALIPEEARDEIIRIEKETDHIVSRPSPFNGFAYDKKWEVGNV